MNRKVICIIEVLEVQLRHHARVVSLLVVCALCLFKCISRVFISIIILSFPDRHSQITLHLNMRES